jgi:hypothetical protein
MGLEKLPNGKKVFVARFPEDDQLPKRLPNATPCVSECPICHYRVTVHYSADDAPAVTYEKLKAITDQFLYMQHVKVAAKNPLDPHPRPKKFLSLRNGF